MEAIWWGRQNYADIDRKQKELVPKLRLSKSVEIWGFEFNPVITLGKRGSVTQDLVSLGDLPVLQVDRGGQATLHSPGQLVIFPMMDLRTQGLGVKKFIEILLSATQKTLLHFGLSSELNLEQAGLYTQKGKIAFVGLRIDQGVSRHGISINVNNDLSLFRSIVPCGQRQGLVDRLSDHPDMQNLTCKEVYDIWKGYFDLARPTSY